MGKRTGMREINPNRQTTMNSLIAAIVLMYTHDEAVFCRAYKCATHDNNGRSCIRDMCGDGPVISLSTADQLQIREEKRNGLKQKNSRRNS